MSSRNQNLRQTGEEVRTPPAKLKTNNQHKHSTQFMAKDTDSGGDVVLIHHLQSPDRHISRLCPTGRMRWRTFPARLPQQLEDSRAARRRLPPLEPPLWPAIWRGDRARDTSMNRHRLRHLLINSSGFPNTFTTQLPTSPKASRQLKTRDPQVWLDLLVRQ